MDATEKYLRSLTAAEQDEAEKIEAELNAALHGGFPENVSLKFVQTVMYLRKVAPGSGTAQVFDLALEMGLSCLVARFSAKPRAKGRSKLK